MEQRCRFSSVEGLLLQKTAPNSYTFPGPTSQTLNPSNKNSEDCVLKIHATESKLPLCLGRNDALQTLFVQKNSFLKWLLFFFQVKHVSHE